MTRYEIDPRTKAEPPEQYLTDLIKPLLGRFENELGSVEISNEGVEQICNQLREIYCCARDFQNALSQAQWQNKALIEDEPSAEDDAALLEAFRAENVILFPELGDRK